VTPQKKKRLLREALLQTAREYYLREQEAEQLAIAALERDAHPLPDTLRELVER